MPLRRRPASRLHPVWIFAASSLLLTAASCQSLQQVDRQEATRRWNLARGQVKARLAADQFEAGDLRSAASELAEARRLDPNNPAWPALQARIWLAEGRLAETEDLLARTRLEGTAQAELEYLRGVVYQQQQRWDEARTAFTQAMQLNPDEVAYLVAVVQALLQLGQPTEALQLLQSKAARFAWTHAYQAALAECHEQLADWAPAATAWRQVASAANADAGIRARLAHALYRCGRYAEAAVILEDALAGAGDDGQFTTRLLLAKCYLAERRCTAARRQAELAVQRDPQDVAALRLLAQCLAAAGEMEHAARVAQRALALNPDDVTTLELAAAVLSRAGEHDNATALAQRLLERAPDNPIARRLLSAGANHPGTEQQRDEGT